MKLYSAAIKAHNTDGNNYMTCGTPLADNHEHAIGKAYTFCLERWPSDRGFYDHVVQVDEVIDEMIRSDERYQHLVDVIFEYEKRELEEYDDHAYNTK